MGVPGVVCRMPKPPTVTRKDKTAKRTHTQSQDRDLIPNAAGNSAAGLDDRD